MNDPKRRDPAYRLRPLSEWTESDGDVLWFELPLPGFSPYHGRPWDDLWPVRGPGDHGIWDWGDNHGLTEDQVEHVYTHWWPLPMADLWAEE